VTGWTWSSTLYVAQVSVADVRANRRRSDSNTTRVTVSTIALNTGAIRCENRLALVAGTAGAFCSARANVVARVAPAKHSIATVARQSLRRLKHHHHHKHTTKGKSAIASATVLHCFVKFSGLKTSFKIFS